MEVLDNLSHDLIRYDNETGEALQGMTLIEENMNFVEGYESVKDPLIEKYLSARSLVESYVPPHKTKMNQFLNFINPLESSLTERQFIPTMAFSLMMKLSTHFPRHHLVISDFANLPDTISGTDAPVIQTRFENTMVPCSTYLVRNKAG